MTLLDKIEFWHNKASDTQFVWFPFYFLKPAANSTMGGVLKLKMILCFGLYYGVFAGLRSYFFSHSAFFQEVLKDTGWALLIFTLWFNFVTAPLWNMRAKRLKAAELLAAKKNF